VISSLISLDIAAVRRLGPSLSFCLRGASAPSGSLAQPWPGPLISNGVPLAPCHFCTVGHPYSGRGELLSLSTVFLGPNSPGEFSFSPCHFCTVGHLPAGGSRLPPGHNFPGSFPSSSGGALRPDCKPYAAPSVLRLAVLGSLPWGSLDAPLWTASLLDRVSLLWICLRLSKTSHHPFMIGI
jgi:hypothetical protein